MRATGWTIGLMSAVLPAMAYAQQAAPGAPPPTAPPAAPTPSQPQPAPPATSSAPGATTAPRVIFRDRDGNPLPPELQQELQRQLGDNPLPTSIRRVPNGEPGDIVVSGGRPRGSVIGDMPPERTLNLHDIRAFGASNVSELIEALGGQVASNRTAENRGPINRHAAPPRLSTLRRRPSPSW